MAFADFLTEGAEIPAGSALKSTTSETTLPTWYTDYAKQLLANQQALGGAAYSPYTGPRTAGFTPDQIAGFNAAKAAAGSYQPGLDAAAKTAADAAGMSSAGAANPYFQQAGGALTNAMGQQGGLSAAMPWLNQAGGSTANVSEYMNPYTSAVVDQIGDLGQRNLMEKIMPGLEGRYIKSGQFQGSGQMTDTMRAVRDTSSDILAAQSAALQAGYGSAQTAKAADLNRYGQLGSTAGNLAGNDRSTSMQGGQAFGALGSSVANAAAQDAQNKLNAGKTQADIAAQQQALGLTGAGALNDIGKQQQTQNQGNLDIAYADFLKQQGYPQDQINKMLETYKGLGDTMPKTVSEQGIVPSGVPASYNPSTASDIASGLTGAAGLAAELAKLFK